MSLAERNYPYPPQALIFSDGVAGHDRQSRALLAAMKVAPLEHAASVDLLVSCGRRAAGEARKRWRASARGALWVQILRPSFGELDLLITPSHDAQLGENVLNSMAALVHLDPAEMHSSAEIFLRATPSARAPYAALLLGRIDDFRLVNAAIRALSARGFFLLVSTSRRSDRALAVALKSALAPYPHAIYSGGTENPYLGWLALASHIVVSNDSINMLSEAIATTAAVSVLETSAVKLKHWQALASVRSWQRLSALESSAPGRALNDTPFIAAEVARRLDERMRERRPLLVGG